MGKREVFNINTTLKMISKFPSNSLNLTFIARTALTGNPKQET